MSQMQKKNTFSPIALFAFNRFDKYVEVLESLKRNAESQYSDLWVFIDGPKSAQDILVQNKIYEFTIDLKDFKTINIIRSYDNKGLANSIESGVSEVLKTNGTVIVIEDDIKVSKFFLEYMNSGLTIYEHDDRVASIHGYVYPTINNLPETFFLKGADCWGWGTWRRAWVKYNNDGIELLQKIENHRDKKMFDFDGAGGYLTMLEENTKMKNDSWAIRWYASTFLENMYTLYPGKSLVANIGMDGTGTHKGYSNLPVTFPSDSRIMVKKITVQDSAVARDAFTQYFKSIKYNNNLRLFRYTYRVIKGVFNA
jgi:hypothetical protein